MSAKIREALTGLLVLTVLTLLCVTLSRTIYAQFAQPDGAVATTTLRSSPSTSEQCAADCGPGGWVLVAGTCGCYGGPAEPECAE